MLKMLVLPATTHPIDAHTTVRQFTPFGPNQLILTKMDETTRPGAGQCGERFRPSARLYYVPGNGFPEDLERATPLSPRVLCGLPLRSIKPANYAFIPHNQRLESTTMIIDQATTLTPRCDVSRGEVCLLLAAMPATDNYWPGARLARTIAVTASGSEEGKIKCGG
ncbi:MAG: hypothetical protein U0Y68_05820 [Blastocatellia bacterium]